MAALTLPEVKDHLNIDLSVTTHDDELADFIDRAEGAVETRCGPLLATDVTVRVRGSRPMLSVRDTPILELTSVAPLGGTALSLDALIVESPAAGVIEQESGGRFASRWYEVAYKCGWAANAAGLPDDLKLGVLELIRHLWGTQRGDSPSGALPDEDSGISAEDAMWGVVFTPRVEQLIQPFRQVMI